MVFCGQVPAWLLFESCLLVSNCSNSTNYFSYSKVLLSVCSPVILFHSFRLSFEVENVIRFDLTFCVSYAFVHVLRSSLEQ